MSSGWFEVDKEGLSKLLRRKGLSFILYELIQNGWDTDATSVHVTLEPVAGQALAKLKVSDNDPNGFLDLSHGFTLFAESGKKGDAEKRGRFNLGEKLVIAACEEAKISSTKGTVYFERVGAKKELQRRETRERLPEGSVFESTLRLTRAELDEILESTKLLLPPIETTVNGKPLRKVSPIKVFEAALPTEVADEEGYLRKSVRKTKIRLYEHTGTAYLYEMGIPVVETDLPWSVEVAQKIPLNSDRDNVTPAYRKALGVLVLNQMHSELRPEDAKLPIIQEALESPDVDMAAVNSVLTHQYGEKRAVFDPRDLEANHNAFANGYNVIHGGSYSKAQWANIRKAEAALPSSKLFPTPKLYSSDGDLVKVIPETEWTEGMRNVACFCQEMATRLMGRSIEVVMEGTSTQPYTANYGGGTITFNVYKLGKKWFDLSANFQRIADLMLHEFGHEYAANHLDVNYHKALTQLGSKMTELALTCPGLFQKLGCFKN